MDDKNKKDFDDLIIQKNGSSSKPSNDFDGVITRKPNASSSANKSTIVTPSSPNIDINRAEKKSQIRGTTSGIVTDMNSNPFDRSDPKPKQSTLLGSEPIDPVLPTRSGFSVKNPSKSSGAKPTILDSAPIVNKPKDTSDVISHPSHKPVEASKPTTPLDRSGKVSVARPGEKITDKPKVDIAPQPKKADSDTITFKKPDIKQAPEKKQPDVIKGIYKPPEEKPAEVVAEQKPPEKHVEKKEPPKEEIQVVKTTTSTLKKKTTEIPEDMSQEGGAHAGSEKYKADTRLDKRAKSLKKYGREFEKWRRSQEVPEEEEIEGDVRVKEGRNSERVITIALTLVVIMILSIFLLFYCNIIVPNDDYDDGRVRISVEIEKDPFTDIDIAGNVSEKIIFPGDYIDFDIKATNAYNITGDNATSFIWDSIFVRFKMYLRIDGIAYESVRVNINNTGPRDAPVLIPEIDMSLFQTYDADKEAQYIDPIKQAPIVESSDGYYYYNGILGYNETLNLCSGVLFNGDAIIPEFAGKRVELVVVIDAATADYTSIRERTIWDLAPQAWITYMHDTHFPNIA